MLWGPKRAGMITGDFLEEVGYDLASQSEWESDEQRSGKAFWVKKKNGTSRDKMVAHRDRCGGICLARWRAGMGR